MRRFKCKKIFCVLFGILLVMSLFLGGCGNPAPSVEPPAPGYVPPTDQPYKEEKETDYVFPKSEKYKNHMTVEGEWGSNDWTGTELVYGTGDPFIMRHNGEYYLYPSTANGQTGIKAFKSTDMINWEYQGFAVLPSENTSNVAYAPEVIYYNGNFYMCQSQGGSGHYIYKSDNPVSGFTKISGNIGRGIDGSFYIDDSGELYIIFTGAANLEYSKISDIERLGSSGSISGNMRLNNIDFGGWVEGPGVISREDYSYITYTANHVLSKGYRVGYSVAKDMQGLGTFTQPDNNITLISTIDGFNGLGHSSNVIGRDLDSIYTAYHNLISWVDIPGKGLCPSRGLNLDRYVTNGSELIANGITNYDVAAPKAPDYENNGKSFSDVDGIMLSAKSTTNSFTAEFNFDFSDILQPAKILFGYIDNKNHSAITITPSTNSLTLETTANGEITETETVIIAKNRNYSSLCTVRLECGYDKTYVNFNDMLLIKSEQTSRAGKIGYSDIVIPSYTAFSNDVFGTSDFEAIKNLPTKFPATHYLKGENRGFSIANASIKTDGVRQGEKENTAAANGRTALKLDSAGDYVKYAVNAPENGTYAFTAELAQKSIGAKLAVIIDNKLKYEFTMPDVGFDTQTFENAWLGRVRLDAGEHVIKVKLISGILESASFGFNKNSVADGDYDNTLDSDISDFYDFNNNCVVTDMGIKTSGYKPSLLLYGNEGNANYSFSFDYAIESGSGANGIVFRTSNYSETTFPQVKESMQGYFLKITTNGAELLRYNYNNRVIGKFTSLTNNGKGLFAGKAINNIQINAEQNHIVVQINGEDVFDVYDNNAFLSGKLGIYSDKTICYASNFIYSDL